MTFVSVFVIRLRTNNISPKCKHTHPGHQTNRPIQNTEDLAVSQIPSHFTLIRQPQLRWLSHGHRASCERIPKDLLCGELAIGMRAER